MRILIAGILGGVVMFVWVSIAHMMTPLASIGFTQMPHEQTVISDMKNSMGGKQGLYIYPWMDPKDPNAMKMMDEKTKTEPHGILIYNPTGWPNFAMSMLVSEFAKETVLSLIAAFLLAQAMLAGYFARVGFVSLIGLAGVLTTSPSYMIWYGFPLNYTLGYSFIELVGFVVAGLVIAAILRPKMA